MSFFDVSSRHKKSPHRSVQQNRRGNFPSYFLHQPSAFHLLPSGRPRGGYSYWFFLLYCSVISRSFLNFSILSGFIFPALINLREALSQFSILCSSMRCFDGFRFSILISSPSIPRSRPSITLYVSISASCLLTAEILIVSFSPYSVVNVTL